LSVGRGCGSELARPAAVVGAHHRLRLTLRGMQWTSSDGRSGVYPAAAVGECARAIDHNKN
jgi:hypothetical protein